MSDAEEQGPDTHRTGIPRDLPDQEAGGRAGDEDEPGDTYGAPEEELPDTDEAGSGPRSPASAPAKEDQQSLEPEEPTD
jgi:hypothetical protein